MKSHDQLRPAGARTGRLAPSAGGSCRRPRPSLPPNDCVAAGRAHDHILIRLKSSPKPSTGKERRGEACQNPRGCSGGSHWTLRNLGAHTNERRHVRRLLAGVCAAVLWHSAFLAFYEPLTSQFATNSRFNCVKMIRAATTAPRAVQRHKAACLAHLRGSRAVLNLCSLANARSNGEKPSRLALGRPLRRLAAAEAAQAPAVGQPAGQQEESTLQSFLRWLVANGTHSGLTLTCVLGQRAYAASLPPAQARLFGCCWPQHLKTRWQLFAALPHLMRVLTLPSQALRASVPPTARSPSSKARAASAAWSAQRP